MSETSHPNAETRDQRYRLTDRDQETICAAVHREHRGGTDDAVTLHRVAAASIGCSLLDLTEAEVQWIENEVGEHLLGLR